jgi:CheY-like chemotaxis protein
MTSHDRTRLTGNLATYYLLMDKARVAIFEDSEAMQQVVSHIVQANGHLVVAQARTLGEAESVIASLEPGNLDVAVVDGNLDSERLGGYDGARVARLLREKLGEVMIIGYSATDEIEGVDHHLQKGIDHPISMLRIISDFKRG